MRETFLVSCVQFATLGAVVSLPVGGHDVLAPLHEHFAVWLAVSVPKFMSNAPVSRHCAP